jgi:hypothetical protein
MWTTIRLVVSENDGRRHDSKMELQGEEAYLRCARETKQDTRLRKITLGVGVPAQTVG